MPPDHSRPIFPIFIHVLFKIHSIESNQNSGNSWVYWLNWTNYMKGEIKYIITNNWNQILMPLEFSFHYISCPFSPLDNSFVLSQQLRPWLQTLCFTQLKFYNENKIRLFKFWIECEKFQGRMLINLICI